MTWLAILPLLIVCLFLRQWVREWGRPRREPWPRRHPKIDREFVRRARRANRKASMNYEG